MRYDTQRAAELQVLLEGIALPATRQELVGYALRQDDGYRFRADLESLPDREYRSLDEVGEELVHLQPVQQSQVALPQKESGQPPGGDDYTKPEPTPGAVRQDWPEDNPPQKVLEQQTQAQQTQQQRQQGGS
jgi:hypothetical protein